MFLSNPVVAAGPCIKYLGVTIDLRLHFQNHIHAIEQKLSKAVGIISKLKSVLPQEALLKLDFAFLHPHLSNGLVAWDFTYPSHLSRIMSLQNKAVKLIGDGKLRNNATPYYLKFRILKLPDLYELETTKIVYNSSFLPKLF